MVAWDWRWRHGPVAGPLHSAVFLTAVSQGGQLPAVGLTPGIAGMTGCAAMGVAALRSWRTDMTAVHLTYRLSALGGSTLWLAQASTTGWTTTLGWTLAAGAVTAGLLRRPVHRRAQTLAEQRAAAERDEAEQEELGDLAAQWTALIERTCGVSVKITAIEHWRFPGPDGRPRETGFTLQAILPRTGATADRIRSHQDGLAAAARLPLGCGVEVLPGQDRGTVLIDVATYNALQDELPFPAAAEPRSVADPFDTGVRRNGAPTEIRLLWEAGALVGETRSGKTTQLLTVLARYLECYDTLALVIDHNGGAVALPFLAAWAEGRARKPAVLWVSDTAEESALLCKWLIAVIEHRKRAYHRANMRRNDDKVKPSPQLPHLLLIVDEFASLSPRVQDDVIEISNRGGGAAVRTLACGLRGTGDSLPRLLTTQARLKIAMQVDDDEELRYFFARSAGKLQAADAPEPGYGFVAMDKAPAVVFKGYRTLPSDIDQVAVKSDVWRPDLDESTRAMSPDWQRIFDERWTRSRHLVAAARGDESGPPPQGDVPDAAPDRPAPVDSGRWSGGPDGDPHPGGMRGVFDDLDAAVDRLRDDMNTAGPASSGGSGGDDDAEFERIVAGATVVPELLVRILVVFGDRPKLHTAQIAEAIGARAETLGQLLSAVGIRPLPNAFSLGDRPRARGYRRSDVEAAAAQIRGGHLEPPDEVVAWRPGR